MTKQELNGNGSFMVCQSDCATFLNNESGRSKIFMITSKDPLNNCEVTVHCWHYKYLT